MGEIVIKYKYQVGQRIRNKKSKKIGTILRLRETDNHKAAAYKVRVDDGRTTKWSESRVTALDIITEETTEMPTLETTTTYLLDKDLSTVIKVGDKIRIFTEAELAPLGSSTDGTPKVKTSWVPNMLDLRGKIITVNTVNEKTVSASGWSWSSDCFNHIINEEEITPLEKPEFQINDVWEWFDTDSGAYNKGKYYLQRQVDPYPLSVIDDYSNESNGLYNDNWSKFIRKVKTLKCIEWELNVSYMCIDDKTDFGKFIRGKVYTTKRKTSTPIVIIDKNNDTWNLNNEKHKFLKIIPHAAAVTADSLATITDTLPLLDLLHQAKPGMKIVIKSKEQCKKDILWHTNDIPKNWGTSITVVNKMWNQTFVVKRNSTEERSLAIDVEGLEFQVQYDAVAQLIGTDYVGTILDDIEADEVSETPGTVASLSKNDVWTHTINETGSFNKNNYYLQKENSLYPSAVIDSEGSNSNGYSSAEWTQFIRLVQTSNPDIWIKGASYMCIKKPSYGTFKIGKVYKGVGLNDKGIQQISDGETDWELNQQNERFLLIDESIDTISAGDSNPDPEITPKPKPKPVPKPDPVVQEFTLKEEITMMFPKPILLEGPVGSGKSTVLIELAEELGLNYYASVMSDATTASEFKGYKNVVDGKYVGCEFRQAVEFGGMYVLEELNATTSNMPIIFNTIENGYFVFADQLVEVHKNFRLCATMNTITNPKDFGGRRPLDKSVRNRFHTIIVNTDFEARFPPEVIRLKDEINYYFKGEGSTTEVEPRDMGRYLHLVDKGMDKLTACIKTMHVTPGSMTKMVIKLIKEQGE